MNIVGQLEAQQLKKEPPALRPGETVRVHVKVVEGEKERTQVFEGIVIGMSGSGNRATFTVRMFIAPYLSRISLWKALWPSGPYSS